MKHFLKSDAQAFISGDLRYHDARDAQMYYRGLIDIGHFNSEQLMVELIRDRLEKSLLEKGFKITIEPCGDEQDAFEYI